MAIDKLERSNRRLDAATPADPVATLAPDAGSRHGSYATNAERERRYATELAAHFQAYVDWAIDHWPLDATPLDPAAFTQSRQELNALCCRVGASTNGNADPSSPGAAQFVPVTPMPWP